MNRKCPLCGQQLPQELDEDQLHQRMDKLSKEVAQREALKVRKELEEQYRSKLTQERDDIRKKALKEARATSRVEVVGLRNQVQVLERRGRRDAEQAAKEAAKKSQREIELLKEKAAKDRVQHAAEAGKLKATIDNLSLKLERQTSQELGEKGEVDVYTALKSTFHGDDIQRIGRGVRGADIIHRVIVDGKEVGRIVYECKNTSTWQNEWLTKAIRYRSEYQTPWVIVATRSFPRSQKWFVVEKGVPVIELRLVAKLADIIRDAIIEIGRLRVSHGGRHAKAEELFEYILGDHFVTRFQSVADGVAGLRDQQSKERQWHADAWTKQARLHDQIDEGRREIAARIHSISDAELGQTDKLRVIEAG